MSLAEPGAPWPDWLANNLQKSRADCQHSEHRPAATAGFSAVEMWTHNPACLSLLERKWKHLYGQILFFQAWGTWNVKRMARRKRLPISSCYQPAGGTGTGRLPLCTPSRPSTACTGNISLWALVTWISQREHVLRDSNPAATGMGNMCCWAEALTSELRKPGPPEAHLRSTCVLPDLRAPCLSILKFLWKKMVDKSIRVQDSY